MRTDRTCPRELLADASAGARASGHASACAQVETTLARLLTTTVRGGFLFDGVLNKHYMIGDAWHTNDPTDPTDPAQDEARWRHALAVVGGEVREQQGQRFPSDVLALGDGVRPDRLEKRLCDLGSSDTF